ncbi:MULTISPECIES: ATP-binding protein [Streptomyces]|uniref:ATP-binding protein n=1 Tax=Streptomyces TaxID=1883 RepID=UPI001D132400|nr:MULTISPECIES: ATP-binding protein [Streptomyces]
MWRFGHVAKPPREPDPLSDRELYGGALLALLSGLLVWSLCWNGYVRVWLWPLDWITFDAWSGTRAYVSVTYLYYVLFGLTLAVLFGRIGNWPRVWRRQRPRVLGLLRLRPDAPPLPVAEFRRASLAVVLGAWAWGLSFGGVWVFWLEPLYALVPDSWWENGDSTAYVVAYNVYYALWTALLVAGCTALGGWRQAWRRLSTGPAEQAATLRDLTRWQQLRDGGAVEAAERLTADLRDGTLSDLDYARIDHAWQTVRARPTALGTFSDAVLTAGPAAFAHPSGDRDLAVRTARHDLLTRQVLIGEALDDERNPYEHRGESAALDPTVLGTSLLAVGPPGSGKTGRVIRPVTEAMCLQALTGRAAVVAVGSAPAALGPDGAFDVIVRIGDPACGHRLDLYGGVEPTDEAAVLLAEALTGGTRAEPREAAAALVQLIGPYRAAYGHFPGVPELRALLDGAPALLATLAEDLDHAGAWDQQRELAARARQAQRADDIGPLLADRLAVLDRAGFSAAPDGAAARRVRPFSLAALEHPLRVRVDLPGAGHTEAARILSRLLLAQFTAAVTSRADRSLFACLVLDDATAAVTPGTVRGLTHLRPANAGAVLALRTLDEVPESLRAGLLGAVGCRMAFSGITTWDGEHFARTWGKEWTEDRDVTSSPDRYGGVIRRSGRGVRKLFTGRDATTETVTVRRVERERWSASELAHRLPPRHAVLSLTTVSGESGPPLLIRLGS